MYDTTQEQQDAARTWWRSLSTNEQNQHASAWLKHEGMETFRPGDVDTRPHWITETYLHAQKTNPVVFVRIDVSPDCAAAVLSLPNWRVWQTEVGLPAISYGGMDEEAKKFVQAALRESYVGDWDLSINRATRTDRTPCAWCAQHQKYAH